MNKKRSFKMPVWAVLSLIVIIAGGWYYTASVRNLMWEQSVTDVLEVTAQGRRSFDVYTAKNIEILHSLTVSLAKKMPRDEELLSKLSEQADADADFEAVNLENGKVYTNRSDEVRTIDKARIESYSALDIRGINEPGISDFTGRTVFSFYERFKFADGSDGIVFQELLLSSVAEEFSITFYGDTGFSHIINSDGKILVRSSHRNSSRTFSNIFELIDADGNDEKALEEFRSALKNGRSGSARFMYRGEEYVYTYVPIENIGGWYFISVIPNSVIEKHSEEVLKTSQALLFLAVTDVVVFLIFFVLMRQSNKNIMEKEHEIEHREQLFSILSNTTNDVFLMFSADSSKADYVSPNIGRVLGISEKAVREDLFAINSTLCSHENELTSERLKNIKRGSSVSFETERVNGTSGEHGLFSETIYCAEADKTEKLIAVISDRTAEKKSQKALEEALNIAKAANEAKSVFLSNMSHDIRTPMNAIMGLSTLLKRDADDSEKVREHTGKIMASSRHMLGLINDILDMSKIESGKATLNVTEINLAEIVGELGTIIRPQAKAKQQSFDISVRDIRQERLLGDKLRIEQILINLLSNAVKYTQKGGRIDMLIEQIPQSAKNYGRFRFVVRDNGMGMSEEFQKEIFTPFTRETNSVTNKIQGTGLGMAITKNLVDLMGGTISVESKRNMGSVFTVELEFRILDRDTDKGLWLKRTRVLVADGDSEACADIIGAVTETGASAHSAADVAAALQLAEEQSGSGKGFDLVLIDRTMPDMDGIEGARRLREIIPENVPMIMLIDHDRSDIEAEAMRAGVNEFIPKPFFLSNLRQALDKIRISGEGSEDTTDRSSLECCRVLVAEDNEINKEILLELLGDIPGLTCDTTENGREAYDRFIGSEQGEYDVILMDVQMPIMNGYEATRAIRASAHPDARTIPIIAMTANAFAEDVKAALDSGMNAHVSKPVELDRLVGVMVKFIRGKK